MSIETVGHFINGSMVADSTRTQDVFNPAKGHAVRQVALASKATVEEAITDRTRAIVPVHYAGVACEMQVISAIADRYGLLKTGGSDCHGPSNGQPAIMGTVAVPYSYFDQIKRRLANM